MSADGEKIPHPEQASVAPSPAFAAQFAGVHIDRDLGLLRVARIVTAVDGGRILNEIGTIGVTAAIANAGFHATGRRFRSLPITLDQLP